jgi:DNA repair protein RadC
MADQGQAEYRKTLRERFLAGETDTHSDETLLELLLTFAVMRIDTRPLAEKLVNIFGSLSRVLSAAPEDLNKIKGLGPTSVTLLKMVNFIRSGTESPEKCPPATKAVATQQKLFADPTDKNTPKHPKTSKPLKIAARRKFQVSRSHLLEFNHFSRILSS